MNRLQFHRVTGLLLLLLGISVCAAATAQTSVIRARLLADIRSTDPGANRDANTDAVVMHIVEGLVALNEDNSVSPMLAASVDVSKDGKKYTFKLRKDVTFHNGAPLTAQDVVWAFKRYLNPATKWRCLPDVDGRGLTKILGVEAPTADTVVISLEHAAPLLLSVLSRPDCGGTGIYHKSSLAADGTWKEPVGTGPFRLAEWRRGQYVELTKFEKYVSRTDPPSGYAGGKRVEVGKVRFTVVPDSSSAKAALIGGSLDILPDINVAELDDLKSKSHIVVDIATTYSISGILFQTRDPVMADVRMRRALALSIDGAEVVNGATNGLGKLNNSAIPSISPSYTAAHKEGFKTNVAEAKKLLKEAGYVGQPIKMLTNKRYGSMYDVAVIAQGLAANAGIRLDIEVLDWATQLDRYTRGDYQMMAFSYSARIDPALMYDMIVGPKATQTQKVWESPEVIAKVAEVKQLTDPAKRQAIFDDLHKRMLQEVPLIVMWNSIGITAFNKRVVGYRNWPMEHPRFWNVRLAP